MVIEIKSIFVCYLLKKDSSFFFQLSSFNHHHHTSSDGANRVHLRPQVLRRSAPNSDRIKAKQDWSSSSKSHDFVDAVVEGSGVDRLPGCAGGYQFFVEEGGFSLSLFWMGLGGGGRLVVGGWDGERGEKRKRVSANNDVPRIYVACSKPPLVN